MSTTLNDLDLREKSNYLREDEFKISRELKQLIETKMLSHNRDNIDELIECMVKYK
jgi:hypothetical protein